MLQKLKQKMQKLFEKPKGAYLEKVYPAYVELHEGILVMCSKEKYEQRMKELRKKK